LFDDIGNREQSSVSTNAVSEYVANLLNQYTERSVPGVIEVMGSAASNATVTVNRQPTQRRGDFFYAVVDVTTTPAPSGRS
jgi:hypothetical protein